MIVPAPVPLTVATGTGCRDDRVEVHAGSVLVPADEAALFVEGRSAPSREELHVLDAPSACLVDEPGEHLASDTRPRTPSDTIISVTKACRAPSLIRRPIPTRRPASSRALHTTQLPDRARAKRSGSQAPQPVSP